MKDYQFLNKIAWLEQSIEFFGGDEANKEILSVIVQLLKELKNAQT